MSAKATPKVRRRSKGGPADNASELSQGTSTTVLPATDAVDDDGAFNLNSSFVVDLRDDQATILGHAIFETIMDQGPVAIVQKSETVDQTGHKSIFKQSEYDIAISDSGKGV